MKSLLFLCIAGFIINGCNEPVILDVTAAAIAPGEIPALANRSAEELLMIYRNGDSIMFMYSSDHGLSFSSPLLVDPLKNLVAYAMRGPQISATENGFSMIAANEAEYFRLCKKRKI